MAGSAGVHGGGLQEQAQDGAQAADGPAQTPAPLMTLHSCTACLCACLPGSQGRHASCKKSGKAHGSIRSYDNEHAIISTSFSNNCYGDQRQQYFQMLLSHTQPHGCPAACS